MGPRRFTSAVMIALFPSLLQMRHNSRMRRVVALLPLAVWLVGCQATAITEGGVKRDKVYSSIVSLSPSSTEILASHASRQAIKGRTAADNYPMNLKDIPVVASVKPDYEKIQTIKPDLVVYDASLYGQGDVDKIKALGAETFAFQANDIDGFVDELYRLGAMTASETNVSAYIDKILSARTTAQADPITPTPKVAVVLAGGGGGEHMVAGTKSFIADVVKASGGEPVGPASEKFEMANAETLVSANPDFIVVGVSSDKAQATSELKAIVSDPRLKAMKAIAKNDVLPINQDVLVRRGNRVDRLIEAMHKLLARKIN